MQDKRSKAHDLFLLMFHLSQVSAKDRIIEVFIEALNQMWPDVLISFGKTGRDKDAGSFRKHYPVNINSSIIVDNFSALDEEDQSLLLNACGMLDVILKKNDQEKLLSDEKFHLKKLVQDQTKSLKEKILEQKKMQVSLQQSEALLSIAGSMAKLGGWIVDIKKNRAIWSDEVAAIHGMPKGYSPTIEEAIDFYAPEFRKKISKAVDACIKKGKSFCVELQIITASGRRVWVNAIGKAVRDDSGSIIKVQGAFQDISQKKKAEEMIKKNIQKIEKTFEQTITAIGALVELRDPYTSGHQKSVADIAVEIAKELKISKKKIEVLRLACLLHDIGKISIPPSVLLKPGKLSDIEKTLINTHPEVGYKIIVGIDFPQPLAEIVLEHHEKINGCGYPNRIKGNDMLLEARILAVADVIEAMTSHRPYRPAFEMDAVKEELSNNSGILFDRIVVESSLKIFDRLKEVLIARDRKK